MRRLYCIFMLLLALPVSLFAESRSGIIKMEFDLSAHKNDKEAMLWIPYPVSDRYQDITNVKVTGDFAESAVYTDRVHKTPMLYSRWDKGAASRKLTISFDVMREEKLNRDLTAGSGAWDPADYALYLAPTSLGPTTGPVKALADNITTGKTTILEKSKAVYDWICENMYRDPKTRGCGSGDVCVLLNRLGGKCVDIHSVFVALARASGVPAREIFGIRQGKNGVTDITKSQHCWAEFYLPGYGWVVVDPSDVRKIMLEQNLKLEDAKTIEYRKYFWGGVDPYRVKLGTGRDLTLNPPQHGQPVNYLMYPFAQIGDETLDWLEPATFKYTISHISKN